MEHTHDDGTVHSHGEDSVQVAYGPTTEQLLAEAADNVANAHVEIVQLRATITMQNEIIAALKSQLEAGGKS